MLDISGRGTSFFSRLDHRFLRLGFEQPRIIDFDPFQKFMFLIPAHDLVFLSPFQPGEVDQIVLDAARKSRGVHFPRLDQPGDLFRGQGLPLLVLA
jgi:hypothetical protein